jgi:hypothetical protein
MLLKQVQLPAVHRDHLTGIKGEDFPCGANLTLFILGGEQALGLSGDARLWTVWRSLSCDKLRAPKVPS